MYLKSAALLVISVLLFDVIDAKPICRKSYTIKSGDTCYDISQKNGLGEAQWKALNPKVDCDNLQVGQTVCISSSSTSPTITPSSEPSNAVNVCHSYTDYFKAASRIVSEEDYSGNPKSADWIDLSGNRTTWKIGPDGLEMRVLSPGRVVTSGGRNNKVGQGVTLNSSYEINFGSIEAKIKMSPVPGIVTAFITMSDDADEIDWEWVGGDVKKAQSNYYGHGVPDYSKGITHPITPAGQPGGAPIDNSKEWSIFRLELDPDYLHWYINGNLVRTLPRQGTKNFPNQKTRVQVGIWDSSDNKDTTAWAMGPVAWNSLGPYVSAYIEYIKIECNPKYNKVIS